MASAYTNPPPARTVPVEAAAGRGKVAAAGLGPARRRRQRRDPDTLRLACKGCQQRGQRWLGAEAPQKSLCVWVDFYNKAPTSSDPPPPQTLPSWFSLNTLQASSHQKLQQAIDVSFFGLRLIRHHPPPPSHDRPSTSHGQSYPRGSLCGFRW